MAAPPAGSQTSAGFAGDVPAFLGRPWRPYSRVIVMNSELPASLNPAGWSLWKKDDPTPTAFYAEYNTHNFSVLFLIFKLFVCSSDFFSTPTI